MDETRLRCLLTTFRCIVVGHLRISSDKTTAVKDARYFQLYRYVGSIYIADQTISCSIGFENTDISVSLCQYHNI